MHLFYNDITGGHMSNFCIDWGNSFFLLVNVFIFLPCKFYKQQHSHEQMNSWLSPIISFASTLLSLMQIPPAMHLFASEHRSPCWICFPANMAGWQYSIILRNVHNLILKDHKNYYQHCQHYQHFIKNYVQAGNAWNIFIKGLY